MLFWGAVIAMGLVVLIAFFTNQIDEDETFNLLIGSAFQQAQLSTGTEISSEHKPLVVLGGIMIGVTMLGIAFACCTKITMHCICVSMNMFILLGLSMVLIIFGGLLIAPRYAGTEYIRRNCEFANAG